MSDGLSWQKSNEKTLLQRFHFTFWTSGALFLDAIGKNTFIDDSTICLGYKLKVSSLFGLCKEGQMASKAYALPGQKAIE